MADQDMAGRSDDQQSSYRIISFKGTELPNQYVPLILSKWLRSLKFGNDYFRLIENDAYYEVYQKFIMTLLQRPNAVVKLAVLSDDPDVVLGFSLMRGTVLDYIHVHRDQRRLGIGKGLIPKDFKTTTHLTKTALAIWPKYPQVTFNPFA